MRAIHFSPRACPICKRGDESGLFAEATFNLDSLDEFTFASRKVPEFMHSRLKLCRRCDLIYSDPAPAPEDLASLYREADYDSGVEAGLASRTYAQFLPHLVGQLPDLDGAVDIGTGDGTFLRELLAAGFTGVAGVEPSSAPVESADPAIRPLIRHDIFRADSFPPGSLSLMTCFQTIEHLDDPLGFCQSAATALKPGGALFLIGHNRRSLSARILGRKSPIFDVAHLQLFSPRSIRNLLQAAGLTRIEVRPVINRYPVRYWTKLLPIPGRIKPRLMAALATNGLGSLVVPLPAGNFAAIGYR